MSGRESLPTEYFYRLRAFNSQIPDQERQIFEANQLYLSKPSKLNDPFECKPIINWERDARFTNAEIRGMVGRNMLGSTRNERRQVKRAMTSQRDSFDARQRYKAKIEAAVLALWQDTSVCCFTKTPLHIPSWSYYADSHRGYALGFDFGEQIWRVPGSEVPLVPHDVDYSDSYPTIVQDRPREDRSANWQTIQRAVLTKSAAWRAEAESRIVLPEMPAGLYAFPPAILKVVLLGAQISEVHRQKLLRLATARQHPLVVYQLECARGDYQLLCKRVN